MAQTRLRPLADITRSNYDKDNTHNRQGSDSRRKYRKIDNSWKDFSIKEIFVPNAENTNPRNPHSGLSQNELLNVRIKRRDICYICGLPQDMLNEKILSSSDWFGRFGKIKSISFNPSFYDSHNIHGVYIFYLSPVSTANAIKYANSCLFNDGRKLKSTFGSQTYCRYHINGQKCNITDCKYLHSFCSNPSENIMSEKEIITKLEQTTAVTQQTYNNNNNLNYDFQSHLIQLQRNQICSLQQQLKLMEMNVTAQCQKTVKWKNLYEMLQSPYNALDSRYKKLKQDYDELNNKYEALILETTKSNYKTWGSKQVLVWILSLHNGYFNKYENELREMIISECIDGQCLNVIDGNDIYRMGVKDFKDKQLLYDEINRLTNKYEYKLHHHYHMDTILENDYIDVEGDHTHSE